MLKNENMFWQWDKEIPPIVCQALIKRGLQLDIVDAEVGNNLDDDDIVLFLTTNKKVMMPKWEKLSESIDKGVGLVKTTGYSGGDYITSVNYKTKEVA